MPGMFDRCRHGDLPLLRELQSVGRQVYQYLAQAASISANPKIHVRGDVVGEIEMLLLSLRRQQGCHFSHHFRWIEWAGVQNESTRLEPRKIENVVNDAAENVGRGPGYLGIAVLLLRELSADRIQLGQELRLGHGGIFHPISDPISGSRRR